MRKRIVRLLVLCLMLLCMVPMHTQPYQMKTVEAAEKVKLNKKKATVIKGQSIQLKITGTKKKVIWSSSKKKIATVSNKGKVTGKKKGTVVITAKVDGKKYKCTVKVETPSISKKKAALILGDSATLKLNGNTQKVTWSSSDKAVATVSSKGKVVAKGIGNTNITAKVGKKKYTCKVTVAVPKMDGSTYAYINNDVPFFTAVQKRNTSAFEKYSVLDELGRCGVAFANICQDIMPTEERGAIGMVKPTGWQTVKYDFIDGLYLYNRCHLIGYQLAGENANVKNLITGTRWMNVQGMLRFENAVAEYVEDTGNHVLYRVTPIFEGNNLVASGVQMEGWSVEDKGQAVCFNVYVFNMQPGVDIDYATGSSTANGTVQSTPEPEPQPTPTPTPEPVPDNEPTTYMYILNTNTIKIHYPSCRSVAQMAEHNKAYSNDCLTTLIGRGYSSCGICKP